MQQKYECKVEQGSGCDLKDLTLMREDNIGSALISKEEVREEMKALKSRIPSDGATISHTNPWSQPFPE